MTMKYYYYTDPLAAAWMGKHFCIKMRNRNGVYCPSWSEIASSGNAWGYEIHPNSLHLLEPIRGDRYTFTAEEVGKKPKYGTQSYIYWEKKVRGCQLHGDLLGYEYRFKTNEADDFAMNTRFVSYNDNDEFHKKPLLPLVLSTLGFPDKRNGKSFHWPESEEA